MKYYYSDVIVINNRDSLQALLQRKINNLDQVQIKRNNLIKDNWKFLIISWQIQE